MRDASKSDPASDWSGFDWILDGPLVVRAAAIAIALGFVVAGGISLATEAIRLLGRD